jgi:hypothetical protein
MLRFRGQIFFKKKSTCYNVMHFVFILGDYVVV